MARSNRAFLLLVLAIFLIASISLPAVTADDEAAVLDDDSYDMDEPVVVEETVEEVEVAEEVAEEEEEPIVEEVQDKEEEEEIPESTEVTEPQATKKSFIAPLKEKLTPLKDKLTSLSKQDVKKIAAFSLGAWGAVTGVGWAMQKIGGDSD